MYNYTDTIQLPFTDSSYLQFATQTTQFQNIQVDT